MNTKHNEDLDDVFMALADKTRREMIYRLANAKRELTVSELTEGLGMSLAAASKHIKILERAKIVKRRVTGRIHNIGLSPERLGVALDWISIYRHFWQDRLNNLAELLEK